MKDNINAGAGLAVGNSYGETYPFQLISGDHEAGGVTTDGFIDNFVSCLPDRLGMTVGPYGKYGWGDYYVDYPPSNPNTRFIALAPNMLFQGGIQYTFTKGSTHYNWAAQTIDDARSRGIKWVVILNHHNYITMGNKYDDAKADFFNLMVEKKVDLIFEGNEHNYQRSKQFAFNGTSCTNLNGYGYQTTTPANLNCVADDGSDNNYLHGKGTVLVITGTGGIGLYDLDFSDPRAAYFAKYSGNNSNPTYGYTKVDVSDQSLSVNFTRSAGGTFTDSFTITDTGVPIPTPQPTSASNPTPTRTPTPRPTTTGPTPTSLPNNGQCQKMLLPGYFYPGAVWTQVAQAGSKVSIIMNPSNGPSTSQNSQYVTAVNTAKSAGNRVLGYVYTQYGARSAATIKAEIDQYKNWYGVTDIFFDEAANTTSQLSYYQDLANYVHANNGWVVLNPGTMTDQAYMNVADNVVVFENSLSAYQSASFPSWITNYPASKFTHLVYGVPSGSLSQVLSLSQTRNAGYVYVTDDVPSNPWDTIPPYWNTEISGLCAGSSAPSPTPASGGIIPAYPSWWNTITQSLRNFLEQLYLLVTYFGRTSNLQYLLEGVFPTPTP